MHPLFNNNTLLQVERMAMYACCHWLKWEALCTLCCFFSCSLSLHTHSFDRWCGCMVLHISFSFPSFTNLLIISFPLPNPSCSAITYQVMCLARASWLWQCCCRNSISKDNYTYTLQDYQHHQSLSLSIDGFTSITIVLCCLLHLPQFQPPK